MCSRYATLCNSSRTSTFQYYVSYFETRSAKKNDRQTLALSSARSAVVYLFRQFTLLELGAANGRRRFFHRGVFRFRFFRRRFLRGCFARGFRRRRTGATAGIQIELPHLVEQRLVADAQHARRIFAAPICLLERVGDSFHLRFVFQSADQRL